MARYNVVEYAARYMPSEVTPVATARDFGVRQTSSAGHWALMERTLCLCWETFETNAQGTIATDERGFLIRTGYQEISLEDAPDRLDDVTWKECALYETSNRYRVAQHPYRPGGKDKNRFPGREDALRYLASAPMGYGSVPGWQQPGWHLFQDMGTILAEEQARLAEQARQEQLAYEARQAAKAQAQAATTAAKAQAQQQGKRLHWAKSQEPVTREPWDHSERPLGVQEYLECQGWRLSYQRDPQTQEPVGSLIIACLADGDYQMLTYASGIMQGKRWIALLLASGLPWTDAMHYPTWPEAMRLRLIAWKHAIDADDLAHAPDPWTAEQEAACVPAAALASASEMR
jgi:hypothetical protein